ncbi:helix-turn-helix transcriptional regulator [Shewanella insulae]|uniref:helix-turn-helix domain-containing protein n=1 Tax=Shewanella insulae TaxID=2681496 RepID=UPI00316AEBAB
MLLLVPKLGTLCLVSKIGTMSKTLHAPEYRKLIEWLKAARIERGLTMRDLAAELGVPHSYVGKVEQCERKLDVLEFVRLCEAMALNPEKGILILSKR